jgi:hypothetical protein
MSVRAHPVSRAAQEVDLKPLDGWYLGFESRWVYFSVFSVFCACCLDNSLWVELITSSERHTDVCFCV